MKYTDLSPEDASMVIKVLNEILDDVINMLEEQRIIDHKSDVS